MLSIAAAAGNGGEPVLTQDRRTDEPPPPGRRADYRWFHAITTRWMDNDVFEHVNNVNYFSYFDTAVTYYEMTEKVVGLLEGPVHCVVAEVACRYHGSLAFPDRVRSAFGSHDRPQLGALRDRRVSQR